MKHGQGYQVSITRPHVPKFGCAGVKVKVAAKHSLEGPVVPEVKMTAEVSVMFSSISGKAASL